jgi:hypothetical protein
MNIGPHLSTRPTVFLIEKKKDKAQRHTIIHAAHCPTRSIYADSLGKRLSGFQILKLD